MTLRNRGENKILDKGHMDSENYWWGRKWKKAGWGRNRVVIDNLDTTSSSSESEVFWKQEMGQRWAGPGISSEYVWSFKYSLLVTTLEVLQHSACARQCDYTDYWKVSACMEPTLWWKTIQLMFYAIEHSRVSVLRKREGVVQIHKQRG